MTLTPGPSHRGAGGPTGDKLAVSGEVNRIIAAAINVNPEWFWHGPDA
jgi:hypothetical protein